MNRRAALVLLAAVSVSCRTATPAAPVAARAQTAAPVASAEPESIRWVRGAAEYRALFLQVYREAAAAVDAASRARARGSWAVVLDADETLISNLVYQAERAKLGLGFTQESWTAWTRRREATALPGAVAFLAHVRAAGGRIAIVTNRLQSECADTEAVFHAQGLVYDAMLCRQDGTPSDKNGRFEAVAAGRTAAGPSPLDVVAFVGDNVLDFPKLNQSIKGQDDAAFGEFGVRYFLLPNPMYGSW